MWGFPNTNRILHLPLVHRLVLYLGAWVKKQNMRQKGWLTVIGFVMFLFGFLSIVLSMVGVQLQFMVWLDHFGRGWGFLARLILLMAGLLIVISDRSGPVD